MEVHAVVELPLHHGSVQIGMAPVFETVRFMLPSEVLQRTYYS